MKTEPGKKDFAPVTGNLPVCAFIERCHLFKGLEPADLHHLFQVARLLAYAGGEIVFHEGDHGEDLMLILSGTVRLTTLPPGKDSAVELARLSRGVIIGEVSLISGQPRTCQVAAVDCVQIIAFANEEIRTLLPRYPRMSKLLGAMVAARVRSAIEKTIS